MKDAAVTLIEHGSDEAPNIGTIIYRNDEGLFNDAMVLALEKHFDKEVEEVIVQDGLGPLDAINAYPLDAQVVFTDGRSVLIEIQQTWIYG